MTTACFYMCGSQPRRHLAISGCIFGPHKWRGSCTGIWWVEATDATNPPTTHRTVPSIENDLVQYVNHAGFEEPSFTPYDCSYKVKLN